jgi:tRNA-uridine 2-sulfurtransferase
MSQVKQKAIENFEPPFESTIVVGMSGGVDSSVAAALLKKKGYRVIGLFMKNWDEKDENGVCQASKEYQDVIRVCEKLEIPHYSVEFVKEYWDHVFEEFLQDYRNGYTPNPDVLCNREIKFKVFLKKAIELGGDYLATGHYCRVGEKEGRRLLLKGRDFKKDQSYFLCEVQEKALKRAIFPLGGLEKSEVRRIAQDLGLATAKKKDSTGICFIGERNFTPFLKQYLNCPPGDFQTLSGKKVGTHGGSIFYTLGQRKGLGLGGQGEPWFVLKKDHAKNIVYVERGEEHPALYSDYLIAKEISWVLGEPPQLPGKYRAKVRYRQNDQECVLEREASGHYRVSFAEPQRAVTPGQFVVLYEGDVCLGGGTINEVGPSYFEQEKALP